MRIVYRIVQSAAFLALHGLAGNQVSYVNHVAQFAKLAGGLAALEQFFRLLVKNIQAVPCAGQAGVAADDAYTTTLFGFCRFLRFPFSTKKSRAGPRRPKPPAFGKAQVCPASDIQITACSAGDPERYPSRPSPSR